MNFEELLAINEYSNTFIEYINGKLTPFPKLSVRHQEVLGEVLIKLKESNYKNIHILTVTKFGDNLMIPDIAIYNEKIDTSQLGITSIPYLIFEILDSNCSKEYELNRLKIYLSCGVEEVVFIDTNKDEIRTYKKGEICY